MKTLYLLRHAKSDWNDSSLADRERPLTARGERDAAKMSKRWLRRHATPELIVSSPAVRALATAKAIARGLDSDFERVVIIDRLYAAPAHALVGVIEGFDDNLERVLLVGHNPGLTDLAHLFSTQITHMPTCALAEFRFNSKTWSGIGQTWPARVAFESPKD